MFCIVDDFDVLPYALPNLKDQTGETVKDGFAEFVDEQEETALRKVLGDVLYEAFVAGLPTVYDPEVETVVDVLYGYGNDVWKALVATTEAAPVAGVNWELIEENNRWLELKNGIEYLDTQSKTRNWNGMKALLKPLIYSKWVEFGSSRVAGLGVVVADAENSSVVMSNLQIIKGQNAYVRQVGYNQYTRNTLYQFLYLSADKYAADVEDEADSIQQYMQDNFVYPGYKNEFDF